MEMFEDYELDILLLYRYAPQGVPLHPDHVMCSRIWGSFGGINRGYINILNEWFICYYMAYSTALTAN